LKTTAANKIRMTAAPIFVLFIPTHCLTVFHLAFVILCYFQRWAGK
jgi:hypothetical protein